jgi:hypothetical protein
MLEYKERLKLDSKSEKVTTFGVSGGKSSGIKQIE